MKKRQKYLQRLYAVLLLTAFSISVLPVKLMHRHEDGHLLISRDFAAADHFAAGHQAFCPVCSCLFSQHYLPAAASETFQLSFVVFYQAQPFKLYTSGASFSHPLRGPPNC